MANIVKVLFWVRRSKKNSSGLAPIIVRMSYRSQRAEKATGLYANPEMWDASRQRLVSNRSSDREVNRQIEKLRLRILQLVDSPGGDDMHLQEIMEQLFGPVDPPLTLVEFVQEFVSGLKDRVGRDYTHSTYEKYVFTRDKLLSFLKTSHKQHVLLKNVTTELILQFDHFLRTSENNKHNTAVKYCLNLKRIMNVAVLMGRIPANPFKAYKTVYKDTPQVYLSSEELMLLEKARFTSRKYTLCCDLFVFQCYTGLAYTDLCQLALKHLVNGPDGSQWIVKERQKTGITSHIPLLPKARDILHRYSETGKFLLPHYSIQKYNEHLKSIGELVGITKPLSSHVGRRTFGNVALSKGISINVISKILGHTNTQITARIYAITTQQIISLEMKKWKD